MSEQVQVNRSTAPAAAPPADERARVEAAAAATAAPRASRFGLGEGRFDGATRLLGLIAVLGLLIIAGAVTQPEKFLVASNAITTLRLASIIGVVAVGVTFVIIGGGIDLSVGAILALSSVWATTVATQEFGAGVMVLCALLVGTGTGLVNGVLIAYGRIVPFIATLAMLASARGLAEYISGKQTQRVTQANDVIVQIGLTEVLGIPVLVLILAAVVAAGWVLLNRTTFGRRTIAIGGNAEAARLAGIDVRRHTMLLYGLSGLCCGIGAIMIMGLTTTGSSTHGNLYELDAIAAAIIGGTLLSGGRGSIIGTLLGVLVFTLVTNIFALNNLPVEAQNIVKGLIIIAAVLVQQIRRRSPPVRPA